MEFSGTFVPFFLLPHLFFSLAAAGRCTPALGAGTHLVDLNSGGLERRCAEELRDVAFAWHLRRL